VGAAPQVDVTLSEGDEFRKPKPGLNREQQQDAISSSQPAAQKFQRCQLRYLRIDGSSGWVGRETPNAFASALDIAGQTLSSLGRKAAIVLDRHGMTGLLWIS
jgi:hypothetical protein